MLMGYYMMLSCMCTLWNGQTGYLSKHLTLLYLSKHLTLLYSGNTHNLSSFLLENVQYNEITVSPVCNCLSGSEMRESCPH